MSKRRQTSSGNKKEEKPNYILITTMIGAFATIVAALITVFGSIKQASLPLEATRTAEALHTLIALTTQQNLPDQTGNPVPTETPTGTLTSTSTPVPASTPTVEDQLVQLIDDFYACINASNPDVDEDYERCWNMLSDQQGEYQDNLNKANAGFGLETFIEFWKNYKTGYALYYCPKGSEKLVDAEYTLYKTSDLSTPVGLYYLEYSFALGNEGWRIKGGDNSISSIGSYCEGQPRIERLTLTP
jgi:hypothetical protein